MQKTVTNSGGGSSEQPHALHNAHIFAWFRHHPLDPDGSLFIAAEEGSLLAHHELMDLFLCYIRQQALLPMGVLEYATHAIGEQIHQYRGEFKSWERDQSKRKSAAGRPSSKARSGIRAQSLEDLLESLPCSPVDLALNLDALQVLGDLNERLRQKIERYKKAGKRLPRAFPGSHRNHAHAFKQAMNVRQYLRADSGLTENQAIHRVAEDQYWEARGGFRSIQGEIQQVGDLREKIISGLARTIDRHFYRFKPYLGKPGDPPLELILDD